MLTRKTPFILLLLFGLLACSNGAGNKAEAVKANSLASFEIEGMVCKAGCAAMINEKLAELKGVVKSEVNFDSKSASVHFDADYVNQELIINTISAVADRYTVKNIHIERLSGTTSSENTDPKGLKKPSAEKNVSFKPIVFPDIFQNLRKLF